MSSQNFKKPKYLATLYKQMRDQNPSETVVLVEGLADVASYSSSILNDSCKVQQTFGKPNLLEIVEILHTAGELSSILSLMDLDYDKFATPFVPNEQVISTDYPSYELYGVWDSIELYTNLATQYLSIEKMAAKNLDTCQFLDLVKRNTKAIGALRAFCWSSKLSVCFDCLDHSKVKGIANPCSDDIVELYFSKLLDYPDNSEFKGQSSEIVIGANALFDKCSERQLCGGHDIASIFCSTGIEAGVFLSGTKNEPTQKSIEKAIRAFVTFDTFKSSGMCSLLRNWEATEGRSVLSAST